jgi:hypothetical protein
MNPSHSNSMDIYSLGTFFQSDKISGVISEVFPKKFLTSIG